jgi:hypothetical protein
MTVNMALRVGRSLVDMGFAIFHDKPGCWLSKQGYIAVTGGRAIRMNEGSRPGAYVLDTTHGEGFSAAQNLANYLATPPTPTAPPAIRQGGPRHEAGRYQGRSRPGTGCWGPRPPRRGRNITSPEGKKTVASDFFS